MSGTRSHSKTAPAIERPVLVVAAHGERNEGGGNARLIAVTETARAKLDGWDVRCGVLSGSPSIESALSGLTGRHVLVWPFFLCRGYFVENRLRRRLEKAGCEFSLLDEFGNAGRLAGLVIARLQDLPDISRRNLLLIAHGSSKGKESRHSTEALARVLEDRLDILSISCAYLEEPPFASTEIAGAPAGTLIVSLFAGDGLHGGVDVPGLVAAAGRTDLVLIEPAADIETVAQLAAQTALDHLSGVPIADRTNFSGSKQQLPNFRKFSGDHSANGSNC